MATMFMCNIFKYLYPEYFLKFTFYVYILLRANALPSLDKQCIHSNVYVAMYRTTMQCWLENKLENVWNINI